MNMFSKFLFVAFFSSSLATQAAENFKVVPIGDINECHVRMAHVQDHVVWEVHDPKFDSANEFNSLTAVVYQSVDKYVITSITFPENNTSKIRAVNAFLSSLIIDKLLSATFYIWVNAEAERPYSETILGKLLISRFSFTGCDKPQIENFSYRAEGQGGFLKGTLQSISAKIIR